MTDNTIQREARSYPVRLRLNNGEGLTGIVNVTAGTERQQLIDARKLAEAFCDQQLKARMIRLRRTVLRIADSGVVFCTGTLLDAAQVALNGGDVRNFGYGWDVTPLAFRASFS